LKLPFYLGTPVEEVDSLCKPARYGGTVAQIGVLSQSEQDQIYAFDKVREALNCMEKGAHFGKTVIRVVA